MSDTNAPEPTMEEILASIRRIISEDDAPAPAAAEAVTSPGDPPEPATASPARAPEAASPPAAPREEVLELTDRVEPEPEPRRESPPEPAAMFTAASPAPSPTPNASSLGDLDFGAPSAPAPAAPAYSPAPAPAPAAASPSYPPPSAGRDEPLVGAGAAGQAADIFGSLHSRVAMPAEGRTLEDVVRELLRPMLKDWLDRHLPAIVEARVQDEVERISRRRTY